MSDKRFRMQWDKSYKGVFDSKQEGKSKTVPDQAMTIQELLERHSRGVPIDVAENKGEYFGIEVPKFDDLTDLAAFKEQLKEQEEMLKHQIKEEQHIAELEAKAKAEAEAAEAATGPADTEDRQDSSTNGT